MILTRINYIILIRYRIYSNNEAGGMVVRRKIIDYLERWKESDTRKPLIIQGARQVGKTYSALEFGRMNYENVAYFNFETNPRLIETFAENIAPSYLVPILSQIAGKSIIREKTLIIFDEIQLCERALTSLKYFCEQEPDYHIIVAGSLLGVAVNRAKFSFPVGKVDIKTLYPMDMEEFLYALDEDELVIRIKECFEKDEPMPTALHDKAMELYRRYLVVGGMPECVMQFARTKDYTLVRHIQDNILGIFHMLTILPHLVRLGDLVDLLHLGYLVLRVHLQL